MLTEESVIDQITILEDGQIQVRQANKVFRDGVEIAKSYHRHVVAPGQDLTNEDPRVQKVAKAVHTAKVITDYHEAQAKLAG
jgi:hypothetical protein